MVENVFSCSGSYETCEMMYRRMNLKFSVNWYLLNSPEEVPREAEVDRDDLAIVVLEVARLHGPAADQILSAAAGPEISEVSQAQVGQGVVVLRYEETQSAVLTSERIVLYDVVKATRETGHVDSFEMYRVINSAVGLTHGQLIEVVRQGGLGDFL